MSATFDHRVIGTRASEWDAAGLDRVPTVQATADRLIVLAAHPDDESLGAGGLLAASARRGAAITVVIASDGENSHPRSQTQRPGELAVTRRDEVTAAIRRLAPDATIGNLGLPDGRLADYGDTLDVAMRALLDASGAPATADAAGAVRIVTPWRGDGHPDHFACALAGARLARERDLEHWEFPIWAWHWGNPSGDDVPWARLRRLKLSDDDLAAKRDALAQHVSQHAPLSDLPGDEAILSAEMLEHFDRSYETFVVPAPATRRSYFEALYADKPDPWGLGERFYEARKRALLFASLPRASFHRAFEPGCATGLLTERLATCCDEVIAWDVANAAVEQTRSRTEVGAGNVTVVNDHIPDRWPDGRFDLVVLSEVGYYCPDLGQLRDRVLNCLTDDGVVVGCHWRHEAADHPFGAHDVHGVFDEVLQRDVHHVESDFLLDVWSRGAPSVAAADGVL